MPFYKAYCISLLESEQRRKHIKYELNNIVDFKFVDAIDKDNKIVEKAYQNDVVKLFPPCFRCGKKNCKCENNVLIPTQVATFYSHKKVWEIIAVQKEGMYLIIEDDIKFNWYYRLLKSFFHKRIKELSFEYSNKALLIRLAWAYNKEHTIGLIKPVYGLVKMSNPMYAINPLMAKALLKEFKIIDTTVDVYVHKHIGIKYQNYTFMPPLAHELSFSHGKVESLIRPRQKRFEKLKKQNTDNAKKELNYYNNHIDNAILKKILVIGHPRSGSGYISALMKAYGLDVQHEKMGNDGIVSWMFTVYDLNNPFYLNKYAKSRYYSSFKNTIMFARDPLDTIPSIIRENNASEISFKFREKHIFSNFQISLQSIGNDLKKAIESYYLWSKLSIEKNKPNIIVRVEYDDMLLLNFLKKQRFDILVDKEKLPSKDINCNKKYKGKVIKKPKIKHDTWLELEDDWKIKINQLCSMLNYDPIFSNDLTKMIRHNKV